ncbi:type I-E CRISPR-associated endoribonuclease Cas2e [Streptomyces sp. 35G-GA-8]|uniref:type I-E CRISPR-associated endoribonuclease Cas2e n=1 Tax=Streptomyces sp. 35G-GA-8 TaxID=2939434 RepID=UPI00201FB1AE|nr:type I-E CRISPR-associated endoribonuclease Cas2e [Streptomyces sp. 35G-GA-8]MCL7382140.1 type I-E CRISPR-associated endoribonuclease Cas2e [Streptomyces sp. 35G-GA-8]
MASMIVLSATAVPDHLHGALSRWLLEVTPELYIGTVSARVRDELWNSVAACTGNGMAVLAYPANNEQGFTLRTAGTRRREPLDFDGLTLITFKKTSQEMANPI